MSPSVPQHTRIGNLAGFTFYRSESGHIYTTSEEGGCVNYYASPAIWPFTIPGQYFAGNPAPYERLRLIFAICPSDERR